MNHFTCTSLLALLACNSPETASGKLSHTHTLLVSFQKGCVTLLWPRRTTRRTSKANKHSRSMQHAARHLILSQQGERPLRARAAELDGEVGDVPPHGCHASAQDVLHFSVGVIVGLRSRARRRCENRAGRSKTRFYRPAFKDAMMLVIAGAYVSETPGGPKQSQVLVSM